VKVTPLGSAPDSDRVGDGLPVAVTVKVPEVPTPKEVEVALVNAGAAARTVSVPVPVLVVPVEVVQLLLLYRVAMIVKLVLPAGVAPVVVTSALLNVATLELSCTHPSPVSTKVGPLDVVLAA
jgi:hypothetical protein